ncbi:hypothetical protein IQ238_13400 [Pleurocapsales cyanobacterium LEGE 06147]|nr:hypothetical protein [Pleurocapsales cyanobacterium LEGE 06147]
MTITISHQAYWDLFTEVESQSQKIGSFNTIYPYPSQLGQGFSRSLKWRSGIELEIQNYQLRDNIIITGQERPHPVEICFHMNQN